jgi:hypothetical protein
MIKINVLVRETKKIEIDETLLPIYVEEVRSRFGLSKDSPVNMIDILIQAGLDGDIFFVYEDSIEIPDYLDGLTDKDIENIKDDGE